jgi:hypothetical protein
MSRLFFSIITMRLVADALVQALSAERPMSSHATGYAPLKPS